MSAPMVVVADDLSGAAELAAIAAARGLSAQVHRHPRGEWQADVIAIDADTRNLSAPAAAQRWRHVASFVLCRQPAALYLKVDSVLRGHPHVQIASFLQASGWRRAVLAPANPSHGRQIVGGRYTIHGLPLEQSALARDPQYPRGTSDVAQLLPGEGLCVLRRTVHSSADLPPEGILVPDAAAAEDLKILAAMMDDATLAAGAADFFTALLEARGKGRAGGAAAAARPFVVPPALLVCGSPTGWRQRAGQCRRAGLEVYVWHETPADDRGGDFFPLVPAEAEALAARVNACGAIVMALGDPQVPRPQAEAMLARFCQTSAQLAAAAQPLSLLVEGGATAGLLVAALDWQCFDVLPQGCPGVGLLVPRGGVPRPASPLVLDNQPAMATPKSKGTAPAEEPHSSCTPRLWIKPGSYLWPDEVWEDLVFCTCSQAVAPPRAAGPWASPPPA